MCSSALPHLKLQGYALPKVEIYEAQLLIPGIGLTWPLSP